MFWKRKKVNLEVEVVSLKLQLNDLRAALIVHLANYRIGDIIKFKEDRWEGYARITTEEVGLVEGIELFGADIAYIVSGERKVLQRDIIGKCKIDCETKTKKKKK